MAVENNESCGSRVVDSVTNTSSGRYQRKKLEVYHEVLRRLKQEFNNDEALQPGFDDQLWAHFNRLPTRYNFLPFSFLPSSFTFYTASFIYDDIILEHYEL